jgi:hypothetical protein
MQSITGRLGLVFNSMSLIVDVNASSHIHFNPPAHPQKCEGNKGTAGK